MKYAKVVIGAGWGDEGKGLMTDFFCSANLFQVPVLNIRANGGAQAGHTVENRGRRHVFHHFGSGTFSPNVSTFLSSHFVVNPIVFEKELEELRKFAVFPTVYVDSMAPVTTPYDMMINQMLEESRGASKHGSCGLGVNETIQRNNATWIAPNRILHKPLRIGYFSQDRSGWRPALEEIRDEWVPDRMEQLGLVFGSNVNSEWKDRIESESILDRFLESLETFAYNTKILTEARRSPTHDGARRLIQRYKPENIVFEGAQGLLLDEHHRFFPHVTRSSTGLRNPLSLAQAAGLEALDVTYVTRCYATRHGAGPFPQEVAGLSYTDPTNVPNDWQGTLRFGVLDLDLLREAITADMALAGSFPVHANLAITCLDQIPDRIPYVMDGKQHVAKTTNDFLRSVRDFMKLPIQYCSYGPSAVYSK